MQVEWVCLTVYAVKQTNGVMVSKLRNIVIRELNTYNRFKVELNSVLVVMSHYSQNTIKLFLD